MLQKEITYTNYNGETVTEKFYFNLTKAEIMEMQLSAEGGYTEHLQKMLETKDTKAIVEAFKELILKSYGERSIDGKHFIKYDERGNRLSNMFVQTEAYSVLFMELATDAKAAEDFVKGIVPNIEANAQLVQAQ